MDEIQRRRDLMIQDWIDQTLQKMGWQAPMKIRAGGSRGALYRRLIEALMQRWEDLEEKQMQKAMLATERIETFRSGVRKGWLLTPNQEKLLMWRADWQAGTPMPQTTSPRGTAMPEESLPTPTPPKEGQKTATEAALENLKATQAKANLPASRVPRLLIRGAKRGRSDDDDG